MTMSRHAFVGIDVGFAKGKRLPVSVCTVEDGRPLPLPLRRDAPAPPKGRGNAQALDPDARSLFVSSVRGWLVEVGETHGLGFDRIAIDAPSRPCQPGQERREAESAMDRAGISYIKTPDRDTFDLHLRRARDHLNGGGAVNKLPGANLWWMLVGFDLYRELERLCECIEVYPQAIVQAMGCAQVHKSKKEGYRAQLQGTAKALGYSTRALETALAHMGFGARHDRLDALLSAWVASLPQGQRRAYGEPPDDVIWVPS